MNTTKKCPRCKSERLGWRLSGDRYCIRCGQRWTREGEEIPSTDRRFLIAKFTQINGVARAAQDARGVS